ncbi:DUF2399 domain-containing protein [Actinomadura rifamycini]|uniref:DUF2399 domain-containing protein n=1 Tax=Actinomadura rifamycini TaxID=31962 RepID=UPI000687C348|nr:DUF2399 domain-containing protein [Actinomadura rifamycini]
MLDPGERKQVARLLGNRWEVSGRPVRLQDLAVRLDGLSPLDLAEEVHGPVTTRAGSRARARAEAEARRRKALDALAAAGVAARAAETWLAENPRFATVADQVAAVWRALPGEPVPLAQFAADVCDDAHALDADRRLGRAVARLAAVVHGLDGPARSGPAWRAAWRSIGVLCNEVSSRVLTMNLRLTGTAACVALSAAVRGEPTWLTLRSLAGDWRPAAACEVFVCENPAIAEAAADRLGPHCPPLVCTDGIASMAALELIRGLDRAACRIRARADFDRAGLVIMDQMRGAAPAMSPWRFDASSYRAARGGWPASVEPDDLAGACTAAPVHEEKLLAVLLDDLSAVRDGGAARRSSVPAGARASTRPPGP